jgi:hypothetical protein
MSVDDPTWILLSSSKAERSILRQGEGRMNRPDPATNRQIEEFNRTLDAITSSYQQQAYATGFAQAKKVWDAMHAPPPSERIHRGQSMRLVLILVTTALGITLGVALYFLVIRLLGAPPLTAHPYPLSHWLILVK